MSSEHSSLPDDCRRFDQVCDECWRLAIGVRSGRLLARFSGGGRQYRVGEIAEEGGLRAGGGEGNFDAGCSLLDAGAEFDELASDRCEFGLGERVGVRDGIANGEHQPVGGGMQDQAHLVRERRATGGSVGGELGFVEFDEVFGLSAGTVEHGVDRLGATGGHVGHDKASVEPFACGFDSSADAALDGLSIGAGPGFGGITSLGETAPFVLILQCPFSADTIGGGIDKAGQHLVAGEPEDVADVVGLAERHDLVPAVMAVAPDGDLRCRPMQVQAVDQSAQMAGDLAARGRLAGTQDDGDRSACDRIVDVNGQKTALVVMGVEQRQLLMAMHDINGVIDIQRHRSRWRSVRGAVEIDHDAHQPDDLAPARCVLPTAHGRLRAQAHRRFGQPSDRQLERRIVAQMIEIVGIFVAGRNRQNAREKNVPQRMRHPRRIARIVDRRRQFLGNTEALCSLRQEHHAAIGTDPAAIKSGANFLATHGWQIERQKAIVGHGGRGSVRLACEIGFSTNFLRHFSQLGYARQPAVQRPVNKMG